MESRFEKSICISSMYYFNLPSYLFHLCNAFRKTLSKNSPCKLLTILIRSHSTFQLKAKTNLCQKVFFTESNHKLFRTGILSV